MSWNVLYPRDMRRGGGVGVAFVCRDTLRARTVDEALALASPSDLALGQNLNVGQMVARRGEGVMPGSARIATMETAPGGLRSVKEVADGAAPAFHANEYLRLNLRQITGNIVSSKHRRATYEAMPAPNGLAGVLGVLGDTSDARYPIFRRNDTTHEDTLFTVEFDLAAGMVSTFRDNPRLGAAAVLWREALPAGLGRSGRDASMGRSGFLAAVD